MTNKPGPDLSLTFASDFLGSLRMALERHDAASLLGTRLERRDVAAQAVARELDEPQIAHHIGALAAALGVRAAHVRACLALEVASAREREAAAVRAVQGGEP